MPVIENCAPEQIPAALIAQLGNRGPMIIPVGPPGDEQLVLLRRRGGQIRRQAVLPARFVPMTGRARKQEPQAEKPRSGR